MENETKTLPPSHSSKRGSKEYMDWLAQEAKELTKAINALPYTEAEQAQQLATNESTVTFVPSKIPKSEK